MTTVPALDPGVDLASDPIVLELVDKERVANLVEGLGDTND